MTEHQQADSVHTDAGKHGPADVHAPDVPPGEVVREATNPDTPAPDKRGPWDFPAHWVADVLASDGGVVHLRPITPDDADGLLRFHSRLSERTRYMRYFGPYPTIPPRDLARMTTVDHHDRVALVAVLGGEIIAVGVYESLKAEGKATTAEVAFVVADEHQGRGLGPILLEHLAGAAAENGFERFTADVLAENPYMVGVFRDAGYQLSRSFDGSTVNVEFTIDPTEALLTVRNARERASEARSVTNMLRPTSVAVIGASTDPKKVGNALLANIVEHGFTGPVYPVNAEARAVRGIRAYPTVRDIPDPVDLAVVAVPAGTMDEVLADCLHKGVKTLLVISSGFGESGASGMESERRLVKSVREHGMRLVGPNALGVANNDPSVALNATLAPHVPGRGRIGFFCQSGALGIAILDAAARRQLGLSTFVSAGNRADLSGNDMLQYWDSDETTDVVLLYLESFGNPRKFYRLARDVARHKPIVAVKLGREALPPTQAAHDSTLDDESARAILAEAGVIQVRSIEELFDTAMVFAYQPLPAGRRVRVVGNSTVLASLAMGEAAGFGLTNAGQVDLGPGAGADQFRTALAEALADDDVDAVIVVFVPPVAVAPDEYAQALMAASQGATKPVVTTFLAVTGIAPGLTVRDTDGAPARGSLPSYSGPERAAAALGRSWRYAEWLARPESPIVRPSGIDAERAREYVREAISGATPGRSITLDDIGSSPVLASYGIEVTPFREVTTAAAAVDAAIALGFPVAVKAKSPYWRGRLDREGARLDLSDTTSVAAAFTELTLLTGDRTMQVQQMAPKGVGTAVRVRDDPSFGSLISLGLAGVTFDVLGDRAYRGTPLTESEAWRLVNAPRSAPLLAGYRGQPPVDRAALVDLLIRVSTLVDDIPEVRGVVLDPVLVSTAGAAVLNASIRLGPEPTRVVDSGPRRLR
ncbi:bifunctional GNAT family N-acetyltransferase/acetate--CoA ligase family protein [Gordonia jinhuaensis]|uniref:GNAT family N-acetyltransferase n=1 Tax=Gordonia jinhuaensis TaxID=1517702 RepID=A0A916T1G8_9ACTN|nr:GNAT family N-acetyltransferase [Gordonia jinhuaensis]